MRTVGDLVEAGTAFLEKAGISEPRTKWEWLVTSRMGIGRLDWRLMADQFLPACFEERVWQADLARLAAGEPPAYILGEATFRGLRLFCDRRALIPRPETEQLVGEVLRDDRLWQLPHPVIADAGTGSGCIACALAKEQPRARLIALDQSRDALTLARTNMQRLGLSQRIELIASDWLAVLADHSLDAVVSNPPYVARTEWETLDPEVREFEPREALDGGEDGLEAIRRLAADARRCLKPDRSLWMEIGSNQAGAVRALLDGLEFSAVEIRADWSGRPRFVFARSPA